MSSDGRRFNPIRAEKRDFQRSREFGRPQLHRAVVRAREQSPAWPPAVVVRPVEAVVEKEVNRV